MINLNSNDLRNQCHIYQNFINLTEETFNFRITNRNKKNKTDVKKMKLFSIYSNN